MADQDPIPPAPAPDAAPKRVELTAADYSLGALDFAKPALVTPVTPLWVTNYSLGPLEFGAPAWRMGRIIVTWKPVGRPRDIPDEVAAKIIAALVIELSRLQTATPRIRLVQKDARVWDFVRKLAENAGI